ncbi:MAG: hypothetical protein HY017_11840 [Betaproteobacteria bacterium]|nr:hypothetical protein [Betaproteobacteria bacterium]
MSNNGNSYVPVQAASSAGRAQEYWRDGKVMVMRIGSALPERCVMCNAPAVQPIKPRSVYWHHPGWYLLVVINILLYVVVGLLIRKKATVAFGLCANHRRRRRNFLAIGWGGFFLGLVAFAVGAANMVGWLIPLGMLIMLVAVIAGYFGARVAYPSRITAEEVRLSGCGAAFLDSLEGKVEPTSK